MTWLRKDQSTPLHECSLPMREVRLYPPTGGGGQARAGSVHRSGDVPVADLPPIPASARTGASREVFESMPFAPAPAEWFNAISVENSGIALPEPERPYSRLADVPDGKPGDLWQCDDEGCLQIWKIKNVSAPYGPRNSRYQPHRDQPCWKKVSKFRYTIGLA